MFREQPDPSPEAVRHATFDLVRSLVDDGLAVLGDRTERGFLAWPEPVDDRLDRVQAAIEDEPLPICRGSS